MDLKNPPERYWHCFVQAGGEKDYAIVNDLTCAELDRTVVQPWLARRPFTVLGWIVRAAQDVAEIQVDAGRHRAAEQLMFQRRRRQINIVDAASFIVMRELGLDTAFAFDDDFARHGFRLRPA